ncbi:hypothetical protein [Actinomarinicola tropica]|uniref:Uncharacterized protein n=1 Tax=Actinomarinicola tropica TaxID=2789776 RepID=A0A5Q2RIB1_9ACTN|nr:hypothetical protein [Actinomarinicola tropica]QGG96529.1 hypothetical protein GH723_16255 [Actinomarinicola tropica]
MPTPPPLTLHELAARAGGAAWVSARLFELVGGWCTTTPEAHVVGRLAAQSHRHAWHAELWSARIPEATILDRATVERAPSAEVADLLDRCRDLPGTPERLAVLGEVLLPGLLDAHVAHRARASTVCDGATLRTLGLVVADLEGDLSEVSTLRTRLPDADAGPVADLRAALGAAGGLLGPLP